MNDKASEIPLLLRGIKKALNLSAACLFVMAASYIYVIVDDVREDRERQLNRTFQRQAEILTKEHKWDELLKFAQDRKLTHPSDAHAFYFAGAAYFLKNDFIQAESNFRQMAVINKDFKKASDFWLKRIKDKQKKAKK
ncbi:MAG: hypothetical protein KY445_15955 [Armatimonadetes bacterium]|nr:hypothetical protein [Armatimonadota bacterium]